jgi:uncharacterized protein
VSPDLLLALIDGLTDTDAVLAPAADGGWWALALRDPAHAVALAGVPMSTSDTGAQTAAALRGRGLRVRRGPQLRDVDTAPDALAVAAASPDGAFARAVRHHLPAERVVPSQLQQVQLGTAGVTAPVLAAARRGGGS